MKYLIVILLILLSACSSPKIQYKTEYVKLEITCPVPNEPILQSVDNEPDVYKKILAIRKNILKLNKYIKEWKLYAECVKAQS